MSNTVAATITDAVRKMYEAFPYPYYSLFGKPRWQEGYLGASYFAGKLCEDLLGFEAAIHLPRGQFVRDGRNILIAGSGEASPYILRKLEPSKHRLLCVDLSQKNLTRARFRLKTTFRPTEFIRSDINQFLRRQAAVTGPYNHIDIYGVLHHLANPSETMRLLATHLSPRGTMRVMVYNKQSRKWIHQIQALVRILKLDPFSKKDRDYLRQLLEICSELSANLRDKISRLGPDTLTNESRLVDTFFHAREARLELSQWFRVFQQAGLKVYGLLDRYGEMDDLPNPLWKVPSLEELEARAKDGRFQNNLEVYLCRAETEKKVTGGRRYGFESRPKIRQLINYYLKTPPMRWFSYDETTGISWRTRFRLWHRYIQYTSKSGKGSYDDLQRSISMTSMQRLARVGAIFPGQIEDPNLRDILQQPMVNSSEKAKWLDAVDFRQTTMVDYLKERMTQLNIISERRLKVLLERLNRSQY